MANPVEDPGSGGAGVHYRPAGASRLLPKKNKDISFARCTVSLSAINYPPGRSTWFERGRRRADGVCAGSPKTTRFALALGIAAGAAVKGQAIEFRLSDDEAVYGNVDCPQRALDALEVRFVLDTLLSEKLGPRSSWRVGEIMRRTFAIGMPARARLVSRFPKKRGRPLVGLLAALTR